ncbi:condensin subunit ScpB [Moraxella bovoculi]|uniref:Condensin subunit ScpB n=2 Tax=Moraxella TaxID=475 RepID=A0AAC8PVH0_9GAMM|nr:MULTISPECIES: SMC-Scp complex subunit ScpB [Moraxella]AKG07571.1 condensin subunit ScpB [Moraxella bovoculi]AKG09827.1 condensin subunit ScpB [Moraxella bovoculi]AKG11746.1 condensin subunit ScpB [Moraxella bovoculi]AKG13712.1 condensin subunit ScpB [Moraxella bovoculi]ANB91313.1 condensin subunit ScpB [Moraxella ovis]
MQNTLTPLTLDVESTNQDSHKELLESHATAEALSRYIEVLLHASETPLTDQDLKKHLSMSSDELQMALIILKERLSGSVLTLGKTASGYRLQIKDSYSRLIQQIFPERLESLSQALLETLSVIAYKQPVTRSDIEQVRGVTISSNILRQLFDKGWIMEKGYKDTLGRPALLHTTPAFLDAFGLASLDELPPLPDLQSLKVNG